MRRKQTIQTKAHFRPISTASCSLIPSPPLHVFEWRLGGFEICIARESEFTKKHTQTHTLFKYSDYFKLEWLHYRQNICTDFSDYFLAIIAQTTPPRQQTYNRVDEKLAYLSITESRNTSEPGVSSSLRLPEVAVAKITLTPIKVEKTSYSFAHLDGQQKRIGGLRSFSAFRIIFRTASLEFVSLHTTSTISMTTSSVPTL